MRDLSLHILDLIENAIRAKATVIFVTVSADPRRDSLTVRIEDNGKGIAKDVAIESLSDPFYTTKAGKKTGLGLSLFQASAMQAGGAMAIAHSPTGGLAVEAVMKLGHIDRLPLGDLAATIATVACTNPAIDIRLALRCGDEAFALSTTAAADRAGQDVLAAAQAIHDTIRAQLARHEFSHV